MLSDDKRTTKAVTLQAGTAKSFKQIQKTVINAIKIFFRVVQRTATDLGVKGKISIGNSSFRVSGIYTGQEIIKMLEALHIKQIDIVSPLLDLMIDHSCEIDNADSTVAFCSYVDIFRTVSCVNKSAEQSTAEIIGLETLAEEFQ